MSRTRTLSSNAIGLTLMLVASGGSAQAMVGQTTPVTEPSSAVMVLQSTGHTAGFCTGIALAPNIVLTAAHCAPKGAAVRVLLPGDPSKPVMLPVIGLAPHPDYRPDAIRQRVRTVDLALLHLKAALPDTVHPAVLARTAGTTIGTRFVAAGFGVAREGDEASSGTLRSAVLTARAPLSGLLLWAEGAHGTTGACTGDSGGPVMAEGHAEISAVMLWSAGAGAQRCGSLTQAVWLAPEQSWIERVEEAWRTGPAEGQAKP